VAGKARGLRHSAVHERIVGWGEGHSDHAGVFLMPIQAERVTREGDLQHPYVPGVCVVRRVG